MWAKFLWTAFRLFTGCVMPRRAGGRPIRCKEMFIFRLMLGCVACRRAKKKCENIRHGVCKRCRVKQIHCKRVMCILWLMNR